jgi:hypothetical protein
MPFDETKNTSFGILFLELEDNIKALIAVDILNNREFDKKHIMSASIAEDFSLLNDFAHQNVEELPQQQHTQTKDNNIDMNCAYLMSWQYAGSIKAKYLSINTDKTISEITKIESIDEDNEIKNIRFSPNGLYLVKQLDQ